MKRCAFFRPEKIAAAGFRCLAGTVALLLLLTAFPVRAEEPTAQDILQSVRMTQGSRHRAFTGQLRRGELVVPFQLVLNGNEIRYEFTKPDQTLRLRFGENDARLDEVTRDGAERVNAGKFDAPVRGTGITYEDLSLRFLYWPDAKIVREEDIDITRCYLLELHPGPKSGSQYEKVRAWIGKTNGVLRQAECYGPNNRLLARFKLVSPLKLADGSWFLKSMRIERMGKDGVRDGDPTYLEITGEGN